MTPAEKQRLEEVRRAWEAQTLKPALDKTPVRSFPTPSFDQNNVFPSESVDTRSGTD